uniref:NADH-ubiquinone oxidoreductase chain 6 n=1 Tax=Cassida denticollis TaxID=1425537 RepID=A0A1P8NMC5_9CUCU|nr:NADH dehydrogenase subunit 6 [Cassida denticollis]
MLTMMMSMMMSIMFMIFKHPVSMMMMILAQTILVCCLCGLMTNIWWFSYMLFMVMIGGLLVLFMYMTNVASNEKFKNMKIKYMIVPTLVMIFALLKTENFSNFIKISDWMNLNDESFNIIIMKYYNYPSNMILFIMMIYLLMTMIMTVKITDMTKGALRQKY